MHYADAIARRIDGGQAFRQRGVTARGGLEEELADRPQEGRHGIECLGRPRVRPQCAIGRDHGLWRLGGGKQPGNAFTRRLGRPLQAVAHWSQPLRPGKRARGREGAGKVVLAACERLDELRQGRGGHDGGPRTRAYGARAGWRARGRRWCRRPVRCCRRPRRSRSVLQGRRVERRAAADHVRGLLGDHQHRGVEVG